jgi:membrane protein required for colicin V production
MRKLVEGSGLSGSDRLLGMVFGLARGLALVTLVVLLLGFTPFRHDPWWGESRLLPNFEVGARWLGDRLPAEVAKYLEPVQSTIKSISPPAAPAPASKPSSA